jgi:hypothetical protein
MKPIGSLEVFEITKTSGSFDSLSLSLSLSLKKKLELVVFYFCNIKKDGPTGYLKRLPTQHAFELRKLCLNPKPLLHATLKHFFKALFSILVGRKLCNCSKYTGLLPVWAGYMICIYFCNTHRLVSGIWKKYILESKNCLFWVFENFQNQRTAEFFVS